MADLSTLDPTKPPDTEAVSQGASRMREERAGILGSFGVEHALTGEHKFLAADPSALPAAGHAGRIFLDTTNKRLLYDNGAAWISIAGSVIRHIISAIPGISGTNGSEAIVATVPAFTTLGGPIWVHGTFGLSVLVTPLFLSPLGQIQGDIIFRLYESINGGGLVQVFSTAHSINVKMPNNSINASAGDSLWAMQFPVGWNGHWRAPAAGVTALYTLTVTSDVQGISVTSHAAGPGFMYADEYPG